MNNFIKEGHKPRKFYAKLEQKQENGIKIVVLVSLLQILSKFFVYSALIM